MKLVKNILLFFLPFFASLLMAKSIDIYNQSSVDLQPGAVSVHGMSAFCSDEENDEILPAKNGHFRKGDKGACCYDWFTVYGEKFFIPNQCRPAGPTITIKNDGIYINDAPARKYGDITSFFKDRAGNLKDFMTDATKALKDTTIGKCAQYAALIAQRETLNAALKTVLSGALTDNILAAAQETAVQPLIGARKTAELGLAAAQKTLDAAKATAAGTLEAAKQTATGVLIAGETVSVGVLEAADQIIKNIMETFDIQHLRYEGTLKELAGGNLGNVKCDAIIVGQHINFDTNLNIKEPFNDIKKLANNIADKVVSIAKDMAKIKVAINTSKQNQNMIQLAVSRSIEKIYNLT